MSVSSVPDSACAATPSTRAEQLLAAVRETMLLPEHVAQDIIGQSPHLFIAGMFTPSGAKAIAVEGGYRVSGRWKTCSGSLHSNWIIGGALVYDGDTLRIGP